jgi:hypothetical protein
MKREKIVGEFSESAIKRYLTDKTYEKWGMTREQYIEKCKAVWARKKYDPEYERKVIVDFSQPVTLTQLFGLDGMEVDFIDDAVTQLPMHGFENKKDIECMVFGAIPSSAKGGKITPVKVSEMFRPTSPKPEPESLEQDSYFVALFDVLGFSALVAEKGSQALLSIYQDLIAKAVLNTNYTGFGRIKVGPNQYGIGGFYAPVSYTYFSDTIMLWTTRQFTHVSPFLTKCADLICEALKIGMPLRGSVCFGKAVMHKATNTFLGPAVVEASETEKNQKWIGATLGESFVLNYVKEALSESLVVPLFCEHFKPEMKLTFPYLTLDWVSRWRAKGNPDVISTLEVMRAKAPEKNKAYYDNTIAFAKYVDLDDLQTRGQFLRATAYHVLNIRKVRLDAIPHRPVVLKVVNEIPHCGFILNFTPKILSASKELGDLLENNVLFVKRLDYPKFLASLPDTPGTGFNLSASGVVLSVEKKHVEYIDMFNLDPKAPPTKEQVNIEIVQ